MITEDIDLILADIYDVFAIDATLGGTPVRIIRDTQLEADDGLLNAYRIRTSEAQVSQDQNGVDQMPNEIEIAGSPKKVIAWRYVGNHREEIAFSVDGDYRG